MSKLIQNGKSLMVIIPKSYVKALRWDKDTKIFVSTDIRHKNITIEEME